MNMKVGSIILGRGLLVTRFLIASRLVVGFDFKVVFLFDLNVVRDMGAVVSEVLKVITVVVDRETIDEFKAVNGGNVEVDKFDLFGLSVVEALYFE